ncbi:MAG: acyl-CoA dehydratase activase [Acidobacteriota bacterium]|nr:acyl-CoA dehydratase activase [Acidobacteriota bacterium]MDH3784354.1 acyl-CoA dehydratase activase [Acidobacteriota bacterium]
MSITAGIDVGSTYTKAVVFNGKELIGKAMNATGFKLTEVSEALFDAALAEAGLKRDDVEYTIATGYGRHQCYVKDLAVTDLTSAARGAHFLFPGTRTVLDIGGQTMKATRIDESARVKNFRLNDKCAAGTGAFLEKTARYMGYETEQIGGLMDTSREEVTISGVCAVFAESEVINHLSMGTSPGDIMQGSANSLSERSVQLLKRVKAEPEFTLIGGLLRWPRMVDAIAKQLGEKVNVADPELVQYTAAVGAAILGQVRLERLQAERVAG